VGSSQFRWRYEWGLAMLRQLSEEQQLCLERAAECRGRAQAIQDEEQRATLLDMEESWLILASSYEMVEKIQTFLTAQVRSADGTDHVKTPLTSREIDILVFAALGLSYRQTAERCGISTATVHSHLKRIYRKLNTHSKTEAIYQAQMSGLIT